MAQAGVPIARRRIAVRPAALVIAAPPPPLHAGEQPLEAELDAPVGEEIVGAGDQLDQRRDEVLLTVIRRGLLKPGERLAIVVTEGSGCRLKFAHVPRGLAILAGARPHVIGAHRQHHWLLGRALRRVAELLGADIELSLGAGSGLHKSQMKYAGALFVGRPRGALRCVCQLRRTNDSDDEGQRASQRTSGSSHNPVVARYRGSVTC